MSSWFGGPSPSHRSSSRHEHSSRHESHSRHRRDSSPPKGYFVRRRSNDSPAPRGGASFARSSGSPARSVAETITRSFFGGGGGGSSRHQSSSSYYKRRPRDGYIARLMHTIKRYIRKLTRYVSENPFKMFMLVVVPLVTGGALHSVLKSMGIRLPAAVEKMMGAKVREYAGEGGQKSGGGGMDIGQMMNIAKMFM